MPRDNERVAKTRRRLWERQPTDTDCSWPAFEIYRRLGTARNLAKVARQVGKVPQLIERWARRDNWRERAQAWDRHSTRLADAERIERRYAAMQPRY
jgi:hypothetical protein